MAVNFRCRRCGRGMWLREDFGRHSSSCPQCQEAHTLDADAGRNGEGQLQSCFLCGCDKLYRQRDFNRKVGIGVVAVAAVLAPFTHYLSLVAAAIIDFLLYVSIGEIALCYHCGAIHRGVSLGPEIEPYDLATHERFENREWGKPTS